MSKIELTAAAVVLCAAAVGMASLPSAEARGPCTLDALPEAPARFLTCGGNDRPSDRGTIWAVVTVGSHCVVAEAARPVHVECDDGTVLELTGAGCELAGSPAEAAGATSCQLFTPA